MSQCCCSSRLVPQIKRQLCFLPLLSSRAGDVVPQKRCQGLDPVLFLPVPGNMRAPCASLAFPGHARRTGISLSWEGAERAARSALSRGMRTRALRGAEKSLGQAQAQLCCQGRLIPELRATGPLGQAEGSLPPFSFAGLVPFSLLDSATVPP